jgi:hypothetical protein
VSGRNKIYSENSFFCDVLKPSNYAIILNFFLLNAFMITDYMFVIEIRQKKNEINENVIEMMHGSY